MLMPPSPPKPRKGTIKPANLAVALGDYAGVTFHEGANEYLWWSPTWKVEGIVGTDAAGNPVVGDLTAKLPVQFVSGSIEAPVRPTVPKLKLSAKVSDPADDVEGETTLHIRLRWTRANGPIPVDDWHLPLLETMPWNDQQGRRAWTLMLDALHQLPEPFVDALGEVAIVRVKSLDIFNKATGIHWPFGRRAILISNDKMIGKLGNTPDITPADEAFVFTFIHELAHVVLADRAFGGDDRIARTLERLSIALKMKVEPWAFPGVHIVQFFLAPFFALLDGWFGDPPHDFVSDYAKITGWVVNRIDNPNWLVATTKTTLPDAATGLALLGNMSEVHLRNILLGTSKADPQLEAAGFVSAYASTDVHEDWAESIAYLAMPQAPRFTARNSDPKLFKQFGKRRNFFVAQGVWLEGHPEVVVGKWLNDWVDRNGLPFNDMRDWWVDFGRYVRTSGKAGTSHPIGPGGVAAQALAAARTTKAADPENQAGIGGGETHPFDDKAETELFVRFKEVAEQLRPFRDTWAPMLEALQDTLLRAEISPRDTTVFELLRTAELHGEGLRAIGYGVPDAKQGDLLIDSKPLPWLVTDSEKGVVRQILAALQGHDTESTPGPARYLWTPASKTRVWHRRIVEGGIPDLKSAMINIIRLWGEEKTANAGDFDDLPDFVDQLVEAWGLDARSFAGMAWREDRTDRAVLAYCHTHGDGLQTRPADFEPQPGDLMRFAKPDHWAVVTSLPKAPMLSAIGTGGDAGPVGEPLRAAKLLYGEALGTPQALWAPSSAPRLFLPKANAKSSMFFDINLAMGEAVRTVGLNSVEQAGGSVRAWAYQTWLSVLNLMLAKGATPEAAKACAHLMPASDASEVQVEAFILAHGALRTCGPAKAGDLIEWIGAKGEVRRGLAMATERDGRIVQLFSIDDDKNEFTVEDADIEPDGIRMVWQPSIEPRRLVLEPAVETFYGTSSSIMAWLDHVAKATGGVTKVDGEKVDLDPRSRTDAPTLLAASAPEWVRARIHNADGDGSLRARLGTLGLGIEAGEGLRTMPLGAWFGNEKSFGIVVQSTSDGLAHRVALFDTNGLRFALADGEEADWCWRPSAEPFAYTLPAVDGGYTNRNALLGTLEIWAAEEARTNAELFSDSDFLASPFLDPKLVRILEKGAEVPDWRTYLDAFGSGVRISGVGPGDFVSVNGRQGVMLAGGRVITPTPSGILRARELRALDWCWTPHPLRRSKV
ncbi:hypothetical protein RZN05_02780 [Sphingomonas sp. HF-S4]|uniref:Uncharacterized protein n=1 Tax=Sphingomonas agrestis TaxID=3080540 RepID=A0ABU3Y3B9_9SPHN|nr:hypothetical protein [Sphingomonas sp. HF-S4]MDV3455895.1 hypothetical protein [Sphingomonas sp. HF-S4]